MDIQFIQITPAELKELIRETIRREFIEFAKDFQPKEPTEYLTRKEVVKMLNINMGTLDNWTKQGKLKSYRIGARVYYKRHEIDESLETFK